MQKKIFKLAASLEIANVKIAAAILGITDAEAKKSFRKTREESINFDELQWLGDIEQYTKLSLGVMFSKTYRVETSGAFGFVSHEVQALNKKHAIEILRADNVPANYKNIVQLCKN